MFDIGGSRAFGVTNATGLAQATITPTVPPGTTALQVSLPGSSTFVTSTSAVPLTVARRATALSVAPQPAPTASDETTGLVATLAFTGADAPGIGGKSVTFAITGNGVSTVRTAITDIWGAAELGPLGLPAGTYDVSASFGRVVDLGGGQRVDGTDDSYLPSGPVATSITILDAGTPTITAVTKLNNAAGAAVHARHVDQPERVRRLHLRRRSVGVGHRQLRARHDRVDPRHHADGHRHGRRQQRAHRHHVGRTDPDRHRRPDHRGHRAGGERQRTPSAPW